MRRYATGEEVRVGDRIAFGRDPGRVVFDVEARSYSAGFPEEDWSYLERGIMIETAGAGLVLLDEPVEDLILLERAGVDPNRIDDAR